MCRAQVRRCKRDGIRSALLEQFWGERRSGGVASVDLRSRSLRCRPWRSPRVEKLESRNLLAAVSAPPILQWFDSSFDTIEERLPDLFQSGYGSIWLPPPGRADSGNQSVGYDVYDRFDLGSADNETLYGTQTGLQQLAGLLDRTSTSLHIDAILNHAGFSDQGTVGFVDSGGYPGLAITLDTAIDGDFHSGFAMGDLEGRLSGLVDIDHTTNHVLIRQPVDPDAVNNIPAGSTTDPFGRLANQPDPANAKFYPDRDGDAMFLFDPVTGESDIAVYSFDTSQPDAGDAVAENALGYLMRYMQWMVQVNGVDGFRVDAAKHFEGFVMDYLDRAVYRSNPRLLLDGSTENVFSYSEVFTNDKGTLLPYVKKNIDPADPGRIGGNRDVLDFSAFFAMRDNLSSAGTANAWYNVRDSLLDLYDDGLHNGSAGVLFVRSHDEYGPTSLGNVAHAMTLMYPGNAVVYFNGKEFGEERDFPKAGRGDALGGLYGDSLQRLLAIRQSHGRGDFYERWIDNEGIYVFERDRSALVGLSNRGDGGFDERTVQVAFAPGTKLVELTGNASSTQVDPYDDLPEVLEVSENQTVTLRVPRNQNADGLWHGSGYVIYGLATPDASAGIELTGVTSVLSGGVPDANDYSNGVTRLSDVHVVTGDELTIRLNTEEVYLPGGTAEIDLAAGGDQAMLRLDGGVDLNGNGVVDHVTPGTVTYGFELFQDIASPLVGAEGISGEPGTGEFSQSVDVSVLDEGMHFIEVRAFRHRTDGGEAVFSDFRESIYVDRLPPESEVLSFLPYEAGVNENRDLIVRSVDRTADSVHVFLNLPFSVTESEILALVGAENGSRQIDRDQFVYGFSDLTSGNHVATVVSYERTGNVNVQRFPGLSISTVYGAGLGDLDFNGLIEANDLDLFEVLVLGGQTEFNPAGDFNGDGLIDYIDLQQFSELLVSTSASAEMLTSMEDLRRLLFSAVNDSASMSEDQFLQVAAPGVLGNDLLPVVAVGAGISTVGNVTTNLGATASINAGGDWSYDARGLHEDLLDGQSVSDYFDYTLDDGYGNLSTARVSFSIQGINDAPSFGDLPSITVAEDAALERVDLGIEDPDHEMDELIVSVSVSHPELFAGDGPEVVFDLGRWWLQWQLAEDQSGQSSVILEVEDFGSDGLLGTKADNLVTQIDFELTVTPVNDPPLLPELSNVALDAGTLSYDFELTGIGPGGGESQPLRLTASADDPSLIQIPTGSVMVVGTSVDLELQPVVGAIGSTRIDILLEDGGLDGDIETSSDNLTVSSSFEVAIGLSSFTDLDGLTRITLRGDSAAVTINATTEDTSIVLPDGSWFSLLQTDSTHVDGTLTIPQQTPRGVQIESIATRDWIFSVPSQWRMGDAEILEGKFFRSAVWSGSDPALNVSIATTNAWSNLVQPADVDNSGEATAGDALRIINELRNRLYSEDDGDTDLPEDYTVWPGLYFDVSGDDRVSALDALQVINRLGANSLGEGESVSGDGVERVPLPLVAFSDHAILLSDVIVTASAELIASAELSAGLTRWWAGSSFDRSATPNVVSEELLGPERLLRLKGSESEVSPRQFEEDEVVGVDGLSSQNERLLEDSMERFARWPGSRVAVIDRVFLGW